MMVCKFPKVKAGSQRSVRRPFSGAFAIRLAKAANVSVEAMLSGIISNAGRSKAFGSRVATGRAAAGGGR